MPKKTKLRDERLGKQQSDKTIIVKPKFAYDDKPWFVNNDDKKIERLDIYQYDIGYGAGCGENCCEECERKNGCWIIIRYHGVNKRGDEQDLDECELFSTKEEAIESIRKSFTRDAEYKIAEYLSSKKEK